MIDKIAVGIDPGASGAAVAIYVLKSGRVYVESIRFKKSSDTRIADFFKQIAVGAKKIGYNLEITFEKVNAMPGQGVSSTFKFGIATGRLQGMLAANYLPYTEITPVKWQKVYKPPMQGKKIIRKEDIAGLSASEEKELRRKAKSHNSVLKNEHKNELKNIAHRLFPHESIVLENADAFLIADYSLKQIQNRK